MLTGNQIYAQTGSSTIKTAIEKLWADVEESLNEHRSGLEVSAILKPCKDHLTKSDVSLTENERQGQPPEKEKVLGYKTWSDKLVKLFTKAKSWRIQLQRHYSGI